MEVIISNSVPLNGGDEALLEATVFGLHRTFQAQDLKITVLTKDPILAKKVVRSYIFDWDLEYTTPRYILKKLYSNVRRIVGSVLRVKRPSFEAIPNPGAYFRIRALYRRADLVLVCPGGYIHDFYDITDRLDTIDSALKWGRKVVLFGHSIGPFWKTNSKESLKKTLGAISMIVLREKLSKNHLVGLGLRTDHVFVHSDIALLLSEKLNKVVPRNFRTAKDKIVINFRAWKDRMETMKVIEKGLLLCRFLLSHGPRDLVFLSTCQGVPSYHDDSLIAEVIISKMNNRERKRCTVLRSRFSPEYFIAECASHYCYIGMRLHGAILSMLSNTPAFNIGYEDKTEGIYSTLGFSEYQVHYSLPIEEWFSRINLFLSMNGQIRQSLPSRIENTSKLVWEAFDRLRD